MQYDGFGLFRFGCRHRRMIFGCLRRYSCLVTKCHSEVRKFWSHANSRSLRYLSGHYQDAPVLCAVKKPVIGCRFVHSSEDADYCHSSSECADSFVNSEVPSILESISTALHSDNSHLHEVAKYYFEAGGKMVRPTVVSLLAQCCSGSPQNYKDGETCQSQYKIAYVSEMIHVASLLHDDVIDEADLRRGRPTCSKKYGVAKTTFAGDFILAKATQILATTNNPEAIKMLATVTEDLVRGEFMQFSGTNDVENEGFNKYLVKTFKKTASLFAYSCKAVVTVGEGGPFLQEAAFRYGRYLGTAFQLVDDALDFVGQDSKALGKPIAVDLKLGLATAPVLFASRQHRELVPIIKRRFRGKDDVTTAWNYVMQSDGILQTQLLANQFITQAIREIQKLPTSAYSESLCNLTLKLGNRSC